MAIPNEIAKAFVTIKANLKPLQSGLKRAKAMTVRFFSGLYSSMKRMAKWSAVAFAGLTAAIIKLGMDAEEAENLFSVSLGNMARSARKWSEELAKATGLSAFSIRENLGMMKVMMESMGLGAKKATDMSQSLVKLSLDMASFYNLKTAEAFDKIRAAISGESEPLKRLGILVNETTIKTWALNSGLIAEGEQLNEMQKVLARFGVIMKSTKTAQGDLTRTANSATNVWRSFKDAISDTGREIGVNLLPKFTKFITSLRNWLNGNKKQVVEWAGFIYKKIIEATVKIIQFLHSAYSNFRKAGYGIGEALGAGILAGIKKATGSFFDKIATTLYNLPVAVDTIAQQGMAERRLQRQLEWAANRGSPNEKPRQMGAEPARHLQEIKSVLDLILKENQKQGQVGGPI